MALLRVVVLFPATSADHMRKDIKISVFIFLRCVPSGQNSLSKGPTRTRQPEDCVRLSS